jgi:hypothetical protein
MNVHNIDALIFIDTNIFLDFYRIRKSDVSVSYLNFIDDHRDCIITGSQVEMEYKKNRQRVILDSIQGMKSPDWNALGTPAILVDTQPAKVIADKRLEINKQRQKLKERISKILDNPSYNDPVYKTLQRLFRQRSNYNLNRENKQRFEMRKLARKRFVLGYPPRKKEDNSIGDAVNWEWVIRCAERSGKDIVIVTRDTDYGVFYSGKAVVNDWLKQESLNF